jgi:hypothetical protein
MDGELRKKSRDSDSDSGSERTAVVYSCEMLTMPALEDYNRLHSAQRVDSKDLAK